MYSNTAAVSRPEITAFLEEATGIDKLLIASQVLPADTVNARAGRYPRLRITNGGLLNIDSTKRAPTGTYNELDRKWEWDTFDCQEYGAIERIDDSLAAEMKNFFDLEKATAKLVMRSLQLDYEKRVADLVMSTTPGFTATAAAVAYTEANIATIDVARDITDAVARMEQVGEVPNTLVLSRQVWNRIRRSTKLNDYIFGNTLNNGQKDITTVNFANAFNLEKVLIGGAAYNSAKKGQTASLSQIWGNTYMLLASIKGGSFENGGFGRTLIWGADSPGGMWGTETYREEERRSDVVRVRTHSGEKIINPLAAQLITTNFS